MKNLVAAGRSQHAYELFQHALSVNALAREEAKRRSCLLWLARFWGRIAQICQGLATESFFK